MYLPVSLVSLDQDGDRLSGYAAPASGPRCCLLRLDVDGRPISMSRAARFSALAAAKGIRRGWCGVEIAGLSAAAALGERVTIRCAVSDRVVWQYRARAPIELPVAVDRPMSVFDVVLLSQAVDCAERLEDIEPFLAAHLRRYGAPSFVEAGYRTFLGRSVEGDLLDRIATLSSEDVARSYPVSLLTAKEYVDRPFKNIPGPFNHAFGYDVAPLDD